jgi:muramoyltetrapeptide carboxypeptidase LdcA involved in peptidoglycan recycling
LNIPVCFDFSAGHIKENNPLILGNEIELIVENEKSQIIF